MVFGSSIFEEGLRQTGLRGATSSVKCYAHHDNPVPIKARAEGRGPFVLFQFRLCLREQAYLRFCRAAYEVRNIAYPTMQRGAGASLPLLSDGQFTLPPSKICSHLADNYPELDLDAKLPGGKRADVEAFTSLVDEKLAPLLRVSQYLEDKSYEQNTRRAILRAVPFPVCLRISSTERSRVQQEAHARGLDTLTFPEAVSNARSIYKELDNRLGASVGDYFFGREPTSFDACLFGHLAEAMVDTHFLLLIPLYSNLMAYFQRILERFFSPEVDARLCTDAETRQSWAHANHVNSLNRFNQLSELQRAAPVAPGPVVDKYYDQDAWKTVKVKEAKSKMETDDEKKQRSQNMLWLSVVGAMSLLFMVVEGLSSIVVEEEAEEEEGEEEE